LLRESGHGESGHGESGDRQTGDCPASAPPGLQPNTPPAPSDKTPWLSLLGTIALTAFLSTYLGIWLQQISLKYATTGISQALSNTSPLFVLPIAIALGDRVTWRAWAGVGLALGGIAILMHSA